MDEKPVVGRRARVPGKEEIVEAVRKALAERGGKRMTLREFLAVSGLRVWDTTRFHTGWNELLKEAGCNEGARNEPTTPEQVLADYGRVTVELGRPPSSSEYGLRGRH
ncbi:MAG TPA: hypothetical protein VHI52_07650, partial [Verrucomicrobiae bacterium]|nr:hypothetical protein [Verrucomicrobiae bacterium]